MKTLAQLKRDMFPGLCITLIGMKEAKILEWNNNGPHTYAELESKSIPEKLHGMRKITKADTTGFYLSKDETRRSFCSFPKASELVYIDDTFTINETDAHGNIWQQRVYKITN